VEDRLASSRDFEVVGLAIELAIMLLEGLQVQHNVTFGALDAELMIGALANLEGLHGIHSFRAVRALGRFFFIKTNAQNLYFKASVGYSGIEAFS